MRAAPGTEGSLTEKLRDLGPSIRERARAAETLRRVPDETIAELREAGVLDAFRPRRYGGADVDVLDFLGAVEEAGHACGSTGWVLAVLAVHNWHVAQFPEQAQDDMWADDPHALASSAYAPTGTVRPAEGGFVLSGRWPFSSGCDHARWALLGGVVQGPNGEPDPCCFLVPRTDYRIDDTWHVAGLAATGSKDIEVREAFVPAHRVHHFSDAFLVSSPGLDVNQDALYRIPFGTLFALAIAYPIFGMARRAASEYLDLLRTKVGAYDGVKVALDPVARDTYAEAASLVDGVRLQADRDVRELVDATARGTLTVEQRAEIRHRAAMSVQTAARAADVVFSNAGGRSIYLDHPIQRAWRDARAGAVHAIHNPHKSAQLLTAVSLGLPPTDFLF